MTLSSPAVDPLSIHSVRRPMRTGERLARHGAAMDFTELDAILRRQHQVLGLDDAAAAGLSRRALSRGARRSGLVSPVRGVLLGPGSPATFERAAMVAVKAVGGERVLVSGRSAAYLHDMTREQPEVVDLVVPWTCHHPAFRDLRLVVGQGTSACEVGVEVHRSRSLVLADAVEVRGIPCTGAARTVADLAADTCLDDLRLLVIDARQRRRTTLAAIAAVHERIPRYPGRPKVARVLADLDEEDCDSALELLARREAAARGFTPWPRPFPFTCSDGVTIEIDIAFPDRWVACECDGLSSRAERGSLTTHHRRQNIAVADGWRPYLIDWTRLTRDPDGLFADLAALLATDPGRPPAQPADPTLVDAGFRGRRAR